MDSLILERFKAKLEQMRTELREGDDRANEAAKPVQLDQTTVGRLSRMDAMQGQAMAMETKRRREILAQRIEQALMRIADNEFGLCLSCDEDIDPRRLEIDPTAVLCIRCAGAQQAD